MPRITILYFVYFLFISSIDSQIRDSVGCNLEEFSCKNGQCISKLNWCDGYEDCKDRSDEDYCRLGLNSDPNFCSDDPNFFLCNYGRCIPIEGKCDGLKSCEDGSDENDCSPIEKTKTADLEKNVQQKRNTQLAVSYYNEYEYHSDISYDLHRNSLESARNWLLSQWNEDSGWGEDTARALIALYLSNIAFDNKEQKLLMEKQLDVQLFVALTRNSSEVMSLCDLSHYINGLTAVCENPRDFNGNDLVGVLRDRVNVLNNRHDFVSPYVYLTLCIHNSTKYEDLLRMLNITRGKLSVADKLDMLSLSVLTVTCAIKIPEFYYPNIRTEILTRLIEKIDLFGIPESVYELSLISQALTEAKVDPDRWNRTGALNFILGSQDKNGSFGDFLATYYTIPILSGRSMLNLTSHCNKSFSQVQQTDFKHPKIHVVYSLYFGDPVEMTQKITLQVAYGLNFLQIMSLAAEENPYFRFKLDDTKDIPFVYSIGGIPHDPELGVYWTLYVKSNLDRPVPFNRDIRYHFPKDNEESIFWLRQIQP